jgi:hypothetical protein
MLCDINVILITVVVLTWAVIISVMLFSSPSSNQTIADNSTVSLLTNAAILKHLLTHQNTKETNEETNREQHPYSQEDEEEQEQEQEYIHHSVPTNDKGHRIDLFTDTVPLVSPSVATTIPNIDYTEAIDPRSWNDNTYNNHQFLKPVPYTSKNINAFYDFLASTYRPINDKYRVNSHGPLV